jgi:DNA-binding CsgD family transcriptional regulator
VPIDLARRVAEGHRGAARVVVEPSGGGIDKLWQLTSDAAEVLSIVPAPRLENDFIREARAPQLEALHNGARLRTLYHRDIVAHVPSLAFVRDVVAAGAEARSAGRLPTWLTIIGRKVVAMPMEPNRLDGEMLFIYGGGHVRTAMWVFGVSWHASVPLLTESGQLTLTPMERSILMALARGAKDESGARELGVSPRTYRRYVTDLCTRLGATSRFQAGILAAQAGLISWLF